MTFSAYYRLVLLKSGKYKSQVKMVKKEFGIKK